HDRRTPGAEGCSPEWKHSANPCSLGARCAADVAYCGARSHLARKVLLDEIRPTRPFTAACRASTEGLHMERDGSGSVSSAAALQPELTGPAVRSAPGTPDQPGPPPPAPPDAAPDAVRRLLGWSAAAGPGLATLIMIVASASNPGRAILRGRPRAGAPPWWLPLHPPAQLLVPALWAAAIIGGCSGIARLAAGARGRRRPGCLRARAPPAGAHAPGGRVHRRRGVHCAPAGRLYRQPRLCRLRQDRGARPQPLCDDAG